VIMYSPKNTMLNPEWFGGNNDAFIMSRYIMDLVEIWDDIVDKDKELTENDINYAFSIALIILPNNPFYRNNQHLFSPLWTNIVMNYHTANNFEKI
jgi:hypothetical protein